MNRVTSERFYLLRSTSRLLLWLAMLCPLASYAVETPQELLDTGHVDELIRLLTPLANGNNAAAFNYLGRAYFELADWDDAVRNCERAVQISPNNAMFQLWLGRSYGEKARIASPISAYSLARKSVAAFTLAHNLDRHSVTIARDLGEYYASAPAIVGGGSDRALALAAELAPEHASDAAWIRALVAASQGDHRQAENEYRESIRLDHDSASTYMDFARYLRGRKLWDRFQQTIELGLKSSHIKPGDRYDAAELLLRTNRNLPAAAQEMRAYIQSGHTEESEPVFRAHCLLGDILMKLGDSGQAAAEYRTALAIAGSYAPAADGLRRTGQR